MDKIFKDLDNILAFKVRYCKPGQEEPAYYRFFLHKNYYLKIIKALDKLAEKVFNKSKEIVELSNYDIDVDNVKLYNLLDNLNNIIIRFKKVFDISNHEILGKEKDIIKIKSLRDINSFINRLNNYKDMINDLKIENIYVENYSDLLSELVIIIDKYVTYIQKIIDIEFKDDKYQMIDN